jgi:hypothetical protein
MGISYFNCDTCGVEMNDCACDLIWWHCSSCDVIYCDGCVLGKWVSCRCSGYDYCDRCLAAGKGCSCGVFECRGCSGGGTVHAPGCPVRPATKASPAKRIRRRKRG